MFQINTAGVNRGNRAGDFRQLIVSMFLHNSTLQFVIVRFKLSKGG